MSDEALKDLAATYANGMSVRHLASSRGWSYGATHRRLLMAVEQGFVSMRTRGARSGGNGEKSPDSDVNGR